LNPISLCLPYYLNATMLQRHAGELLKLPKDLRRYIHLVVVDDGSPTSPALEALGNIGWSALNGSLGSASLYRMDVDVRWNQDACRNLAALKAPTKWLLLTDIDHLVPEATWKRLITRPLGSKAVYRFGRVSMPDLAAYKPHPNSWLMQRATYDKAGGYDERFAGWYGTDADFRDRVQKVAKVEQLPQVLIRVPREVIPDASTTTYQRKTPEDGANIQRIKAERKADPDPSPKRGLFPWTKIL
jgi:hypothetical protein